MSLGASDPPLTPADGAQPRLLSLPILQPSGGQLARNILLFFALVAFIAANISVSLLFAGTTKLPPPQVLIGLCIPIMAFLTASLIGAASARSGARKRLTSEDDPVLRALLGVIAADNLTIFKSSSDKRWRTLLELPNRPATVVDSEIAPSLPSGHHVLLEPEAINQSQRGMWAVGLMFLFLGAASSVQGGTARWWNVVVFLVLAVTFFLRVPEIRNAFPILRDTGRDLVAGPGWIRQANGRRWTIADSMVIVSRSSNAGPRSAVAVRLIGPPGVRDLRFARIDDPDFLLLWERWTTSMPRLDLE